MVDTYEHFPWQLHTCHAMYITFTRTDKLRSTYSAAENPYGTAGISGTLTSNPKYFFVINNKAHRIILRGNAIRKCKLCFTNEDHMDA